MLKDLWWQNLADRRKDLRLALLFKIVNGTVAIPVGSVDLEPTHMHKTRASHQFKFQTIRCKKE